MSPIAHDFRRQHFQSPAQPDLRWQEWFREEMARCVFQVDVEADADVPFHFAGTSRQLPELAIFLGSASPMQLTPTTDAIREGSIGLSIALQGDLAFHSNDDDLAVAHNAGAFGKPRILETRSGLEFLTVRLSPRILAPLVSNLQDLSLVSMPAESRATRLLFNYIRMLDAEETIADPEMQNLIALHIHDIVALGLGATRDGMAIVDGRGLRAARLAAIKAYIFDNLDRPRLSINTAAAREGVTPRYVQMLFEVEGSSFSQFVLEQRLVRAHRMLTDPRMAGIPIQEVALRTGFGDLSYFNRTFRRRFGMTPSDVRNKAREPR